MAKKSGKRKEPPQLDVIDLKFRVEDVLNGLTDGLLIVLKGHLLVERGAV